MKELLKIFLALFFICLITFSTINVFAADTVILNQTNSTNSTNTTKTITKNAVVQPMVATGITVTPTTINLGTLPADGKEYTFTSAANVTVTAWALLVDDGNVTVRASGNFVNSADTSKTIPLTNFKYGCQGYVDKTSFTTSDSLVANYDVILYSRITYHMDYYLTIPTGTDPGTYTTTIYYMAT